MLFRISVPHVRRAVLLLLFAALAALFFVSANAQELSELMRPDQPTVNGATFSWNEIENVVRYRVQWRLKDTDGWPSENKATTGTTTQYTLSGVAAGTYEVRVRAIADRETYDHSPWSPSADVVINAPPPPTEVPAATEVPAPTQLDTPNQPTTSGDLDNGYTVSWNSVLNASNYILRWREQGTQDWLEVARTGQRYLPYDHPHRRAARQDLRSACACPQRRSDPLYP